MNVIKKSDVMFNKAPVIGGDKILGYIQAVENVLKLPFVQQIITRLVMRASGTNPDQQGVRQPANVLASSTPSTPYVTPEAPPQAQNNGFSAKMVYDMLIRASPQIINYAGDLSVREFFRQIQENPVIAITAIEEGMIGNANANAQPKNQEIHNNGDSGQRKDGASSVRGAAPPDARLYTPYT